jgi:hypothetical protein
MALNRVTETVSRIPDDLSQPLTPAQRMLHGARSEADYHERIVASTVDDHGAAIEAVIQAAVERRRQRHKALTDYLKPNTLKPEGGNPRFLSRSGNWREANEAYKGALDCLAAALGVLYPDLETGQSRWAYPEAIRLVEVRTGPLCTGFRADLGSPLQHHPEEPCPVCPTSA